MTDKKKRVIGLLINLVIVFIFFWVDFDDARILPEYSLIAILLKSFEIDAPFFYWLLTQFIALFFVWRWRAKTMEILLSLYNKI